MTANDLAQWVVIGALFLAVALREWFTESDT